MHGRDGKLILAVVVIGVLWGLNWPAVKFMLSEVPPLTLRAMAFPLAAVILAAIARDRRLAFLPPRNEWPLMVVTGLLVVFGFNMMSTFGQLHTEASMAVIIAYTMPGMTAVLAALILKERIAPRQVAAVWLATSGVGVLVSEDLPGLFRDPLGLTFMLLAAFFWALGNIALKSRSWSLSSIVLTVWFFVFSAILSWPIAFIFESPLDQGLPSPAVAWTFAYHVIGPMVICYALWTVIVERLPASIAAITALLAPIVGVTSAVVLLGEPVSWQKSLALLLVLTSIALALASRR
ncbi:MAG: DMT family transporter [Alphaproteobacteria bacterium]|nr:DMT family transporter [Alphaproteobacteria bacterium]